MAPPDRNRMRVFGSLLLYFTLMTVLGGGFSCSWNHSSDDDDDDRSRDDDDGSNLVQTDTGGAPGMGLDLVERLAAMAPVFIEPLPSVTVDLPPFDPEHYRMVGFHITPGQQQGEAAVRAVDIWDGPSVTGAFGPGSYGAAELAAFAERVRLAHPELLGLPEQCGTLQLQGTAFVDGLILVRWVQTLHPDDSPASADPEHRLTVVLDGLGRLIHIENAVDVPAG